MRANLAAIRHLEEAVLGAEWTEGIVLRYGALYGAGTSMAPGGTEFELIRRRKLPVVGRGGGVWSFVHVADAAEAAAACKRTVGEPRLLAVQQPRPRVQNGVRGAARILARAKVLLGAPCGPRALAPLGRDRVRRRRAAVSSA